MISFQYKAFWVLLRYTYHYKKANPEKSIWFESGAFFNVWTVLTLMGQYHWWTTFIHKDIYFQEYIIIKTLIPRIGSYFFEIFTWDNIIDRFHDNIFYVVEGVRWQCGSAYAYGQVKYIVSCYSFVAFVLEEKKEIKFDPIVVL